MRSELVAERASWIRDRLAALRALPLGTYEEFESDLRNPAAAESHLRRALEALLDLGRHVLVKRFARATAEYKQIAVVLTEVGVLDPRLGRMLTELAGYRNRMVHFYHEVSRAELYQLCSQEVDDIELVLDTMLAWIAADVQRTTDQEPT